MNDCCEPKEEGFQRNLHAQKRRSDDAIAAATTQCAVTANYGQRGSVGRLVQDGPVATRSDRSDG